MAFSWTFLAVGLFAWFAVSAAETEIAANNSATAELNPVPRPIIEVSTTDKPTIVKGFKAIHRLDSDLVTIGNAGDENVCLEGCQSHNGCDFVSYNNATGHCQGFTAKSRPFFEKSADYILLTGSSSKQNFTKYDGLDDPRGDLVLQEKYRDADIFGINVPTPEVCLKLCKIHPKCNTASVPVDGAGWRNCYLKYIKEFMPKQDPTMNTYYAPI